MTALGGTTGRITSESHIKIKKQKNEIKITYIYRVAMARSNSG